MRETFLRWRVRFQTEDRPTGRWWQWRRSLSLSLSLRHLRTHAQGVLWKGGGGYWIMDGDMRRVG